MKPALLAALLALAAPASAAAPRRVLVIGLDGFDWSILSPLAAAGRLPNLSRLIAAGTSGVMRVPPPLRSPAIWTTIATGAPPAEHGIEDFFVGDRRVSSADRRSAALWESASASSRTVLIVGWLATWPAEAVRGVIVSDQALNPFVREGGVFPPGLAVRPAWDYLGAQAAERLERFLPFRWDPDYARHEKKGSPEYRRDDMVKRRLSWVYMRDESHARVAERLLRRDRPDLTMIHLWGADHVSHGFWREAYGAATAEERRDFGRLIPEYYAYLDEVVGRLVRAAGPDVLVVALSDHGFQAWTPPPGDPHPELSGNHREEAVLIVSGPGARRGAKLEGAVPLDIAPTILRALDLPAYDGMRGRVLEDAFADGALPPPKAAIPAPRRPAAPASPSELSPAEADRLRAMGYLR